MKGIDYDLEGCLEYNPQDGFTVDDIQKILAVWEGERDEADWHWVLKLTDNRFVYLRGGCDYTGWDCQSWANHVVMNKEKPLMAAMKELADWRDFLPTVYQSLIEQLNTRKEQTWREKMDKEFGL